MSVNAINVNPQSENVSSSLTKKRVAVGLTVGTVAAGGGFLGYKALDKFAKMAKENADSFKKVKTLGALAGAVAAGGLMASIAGKALRMGKVRRSKEHDISFVVTTTDGKKIEYPVMLGCTTKIIPLPNKKYVIMRKASVPNAQTESVIVSEKELLQECAKFVK